MKRCGPDWHTWFSATGRWPFLRFVRLFSYSCYSIENEYRNVKSEKPDFSFLALFTSFVRP
jgi:hypothetical protein